MNEEQFLTGIDLQAALTALCLRCGLVAWEATGLLLGESEKNAVLQAAREALSELEDDEDPYATNYEDTRARAVESKFLVSISKTLNGQQTQMVTAWCLHLVQARNDTEWYERFLKFGDLLRALSRVDAAPHVDRSRLIAICGKYLQSKDDESLRLSMEKAADDFDRDVARRYSRSTPPVDSLVQLIWFVRVQELTKAVAKEFHLSANQLDTWLKAQLRRYESG